MNLFDLFIAAIVIYAFVKGFLKGLFVEIASLIALAGGVYGAVHFSYLVADILKDYVNWSENYISLTAFGITFVAIVIAVSMLGKALTKIADLAALGFLNKVLGGVFGLLKSILILSVLLVFFDKINNTVSFVNKETLSNSILYQPVKSVIPTVFPSLFEVDTEES